MDLLANLLGDALHLVVMGLDVLCFFVVVRLLVYHWSHPGLSAFDNIGRSLVRWFVAHLERGLCHISSGNHSEQTLLVCGLLIAATMRLSLAAVAAALSAV
jgi:hypothetical protein